MSEDLSAGSLAAALPGRPLRCYPALLSTHADALAWARSGAPEGAVVTADYQASPRGRAGLEWHVEPGVSAGLSLVLRPALPPEREGWLYTVAVCGLSDVFGAGASIRWPDEVVLEAEPVAATGVQVQLGPQGIEWAVVSICVPRPLRSRLEIIRDVVEATEARYRLEPDSVLSDYRARCETFRKRVRARLIPMGPGGPQVSGVATDTRLDGSLVIRTDAGRRVSVRPQNLGLLDYL